MTIVVPRGVPLVLRWDLDKTYLRTEFDKVSDLIRLARESADQKQAVPGATTLLKGLVADTPCRLTFVSGSPTQMRQVLEEKLRLDGIDADRLILKPNLAHLKRGRFRAVRGQVAYKLPALLSQRALVPQESPEVCFGDDAEADALIYLLYGDVLSGRVDDGQLREILTQSGAYADQCDQAVELAQTARARARRRNPVKRIFIHLDRKSEPARFGVYGTKVVAISNYAQAALVLHLDGVLTLARMVDVFDRLIDVHQRDERQISNAVQALIRRGAVDRLRVDAALIKWEASSPSRLASLRERIAKSIARLGSEPLSSALVADGAPDYLALIAQGHLHRS